MALQLAFRFHCAAVQVTASLRLSAHANQSFAHQPYSSKISTDAAAKEESRRARPVAVARPAVRARSGHAGVPIVGGVPPPLIAISSHIENPAPPPWRRAPRAPERPRSSGGAPMGGWSDYRHLSRRMMASCWRSRISSSAAAERWWVRVRVEAAASCWPDLFRICKDSSSYPQQRQCGWRRGLILPRVHFYRGWADIWALKWSILSIDRVRRGIHEGDPLPGTGAGLQSVTGTRGPVQALEYPRFPGSPAEKPRSFESPGPWTVIDEVLVVAGTPSSARC